MECDKLSKDLQKINIGNSLKKLDVYYCIDLSDQDIDNISKCLETYIVVFFKDYKLNIFKRLDYISKNKSDVVKSGLCTFNKMYNDLIPYYKKDVKSLNTIQNNKEFQVNY